MSVTLAPIDQILLAQDFSNNAALDPTKWHINQFESVNNPSFYGRTQIMQSLPTVSGGALRLTLQTYNPTGPGSFYGSEMISDELFNINSGGIAFTATAKIDGTPTAGMVGGIFAYNFNNTTSLDNEIDTEILTNNATVTNNPVQTNIYQNQSLGAGNPVFVPDPTSQATYQTYTMEWFPNAVLWFINGTFVHEDTIHVPGTPMPFHINFWAPGTDWADAYSASLQPATIAQNNTIFTLDVSSLSVDAIGRVLDWTGASNTNFANAANWNDTTTQTNPATSAPTAADEADFETTLGAVTGTGTVAAIIVGSTASGALQLSGTAVLTAGSLDAGVSAGAVGQIGLTGTGAILTVTGGAVVADDGTGVLSVLSGATFGAASLTIGSQADSSGAVVVSGAGSLINLSGALNVGTAQGIGDLTIGPGATVNAGVVNLNGDVVLEGGELDPSVNLINPGNTLSGSGVIANNVIVDEGLLLANGQKLSQRLLTITGTIVGGGTLTVNGTVTASGSPGIVQINASDTIDLTGPVVNAATTTFTDNQTPTGTYTVNNSVIDVVFADGTGVLLLDDIAGFGGTIATFKTGDQFVIGGGTLSNVGVTNGDTLTFSDSGTKAVPGGVDSLIFGSGVTASRFNIVNGNTVQAVACFAEGTRIETTAGMVNVEDLSVGDIVRTADGRQEPIVWLGRRTVDCACHPAPETVWPVWVAAGAFGRHVPVRDLYLSPDHAIFVDGVLVPVKLLVNGTSIVQVERQRVTYHHVQLSRHEVIRAEGLAVESYLGLGDRMDFHGGETIRLFPDFAARPEADAAGAWETAGAAPLVLAGPELMAVRRAIRVRQSRDRRSSEARRAAR